MRERCQAPSDFIEANPWMLKGTIMKIGSGSTTGVSFQAGASSSSEPKGTSSNEHLLNAAGAMLFSNRPSAGGKRSSPADDVQHLKDQAAAEAKGRAEAFGSGHTTSGIVPETFGPHKYPKPLEKSLPDPE